MVAQTEVWTMAITICVGLTIAVGVISITFEVMSIIFTLTPTDKDDKWLAKVEKYWLKIKPFMEWFHVKTPAMLIINKILQRVKEIRKTVEENKENKENKETTGSGKSALKTNPSEKGKE